jgi:hypothetical protein
MDRAGFVVKCGELLRIAKPHLVSCVLKKGEDILVSENKKLYERYVPDDEYVIITCENGARYVRPIESNSLIAIAVEIFSSMVHK